MAVEGSLVGVNIFLFVYLDMGKLLEAAQVQMLNIEPVDLVGERVFLGSFFLVFITDVEENAASINLVLVHNTHLLEGVSASLVLFKVWLF